MYIISLSLHLSLYIYIYIHLSLSIYIYIYTFIDQDCTAYGANGCVPGHSARNMGVHGVHSCIWAIHGVYRGNVGVVYSVKRNMSRCTGARRGYRGAYIVLRAGTRDRYPTIPKPIGATFAPMPVQQRPLQDPLGDLRRGAHAVLAPAGVQGRQRLGSIGAGCRLRQVLKLGTLVFTRKGG